MVTHHAIRLFLALHALPLNLGVTLPAIDAIRLLVVNKTETVVVDVVEIYQRIAVVCVFVQHFVGGALLALLLLSILNAVQHLISDLLAVSLSIGIVVFNALEAVIRFLLVDDEAVGFFKGLAI